MAASALPGEDEVIQRLYDAAVAPALWQDAVDGLARLAGGADVARLTGWDRASNSSPLLVRSSRTLDDASLRAHEALYFGHFRPFDPRLEVAATHLHQTIGSCEQYLGERYADGSGFYQDFMKPQCDIRWTAGGRVFERGDIYVDFALERVRERASFSTEEVERLRWVQPHLQRALVVHMACADARLHAARTSVALDQVDQGVVALGTRGRVLFANRRAEAMFAMGGGLLSVRRGHLVSSAGEDLAAAIDRVLETGRPSSHRLVGTSADGTPVEWALMLVRAGGANAPVARVLDVPVAAPAHVVALVHARGGRRPSGRQLMQLFGLTAAEARVTRCLLAGLSPEESADELAVSISTVRTHIRAVLAKTGSRNQAALFSNLAGLPVVREGAQARGD